MVIMSKKTEARREQLRSRLIDAAERRVAEGGVDALRARELAAEVGCALGAIYTVFDDLTELALAVNGRTFRRLGAAVAEAVARQGEAAPGDQLVTMGCAYLHFAAANPKTWRAIFELKMTDADSVPGWYLEEMARLFALIAEPLSRLRPDLPPEDVQALTRALFSSVHGIVLLGLEKRLSAVPADRIEAMIAMVLRNFVGQPEKV
jgi:AcrR family transcriptional regulator